MFDFVRIFGDQLADGEAGKGTWRFITVGDGEHTPRASAVISCPDCSTQFGLGDYEVEAGGIVRGVECRGRRGRCTFQGTVRLVGWSD